MPRQFAASQDPPTPSALPLPTATRVHLPRSRALSRHVKALNTECYRNAVLALQSDTALDAAGAVYVEGLVVAHRGLLSPFEHAWLELPDGTVIDPTPTYCKRGTPPRTYCGAFRWTRDEAFALCMVPDATYTFRLRLPNDGRDDPRWATAALAACSASEALFRHHLGQPFVPEHVALSEWARGF